MVEIYDIIVIGGGPAGYTAGIYGSRAGRKVLLFTGDLPGGQLMLTTIVEDFPGFPDGIMGPELMERMRKQTERFNVDIIDEKVVDVDFDKKPFTVKTSSKEFKGRTVIIAVGSSHKWLGIPSEEKFKGKGVSTCAVCDGFLYKDKEVAVVGGGDAAMREAAFLSNICKKVYVIHRRDKLRAQKALQDLVMKKKNVEFIWNSEVKEFIGNEELEAVKLINNKNNEERILKLDGVFLAIGHKPNTEFLRGKIEMDEKGYIVVRDRTKTSVEGVFAAGDVADKFYRQAVTAAALGCMAAMDADDYLHGYRSLSKSN